MEWYANGKTGGRTAAQCCFAIQQRVAHSTRGVCKIARTGANTPREKVKSEKIKRTASNMHEEVEKNSERR